MPMNDNSMILHWLFALTHIGFLVLVFISLFYKKYSFKGPKQMPNNKVMLSCVVLVDLNLVMCFLSLLYWYRNGLSKQNIVTFSGTLLRTLVWLFVSGYLHNYVSKSALRIWWFSSFLNFCFCLVLDYVFYQQIHSLAPRFLVLDASSVIVSLFLCYVGFSVNNGGGTISHFYYQSLLHGSEAITPSATSNIVSLVTFAWIHPLISIGYKKRLDLEDVPQLDSLNSARRSFSVLRNKLESDKRKSSQVNTFSLVKAVILTIWKDIIISGLLCFVYTLASYVGPFLIDTLVKYLTGHRDLNTGLLLVSAFFGAKIVECFAARHCDLKKQQAGINARAALVAMIYHKGLTLSSQSKQGHSNGEIINFMAVDAERIGEFSKFMHAPWMTVVQIGLSLAILYKNLGISSLATFVVTIAIMLSDLPLGSFQEKYQAKLMEYKDKRMKTTFEILKNMRILKLYGWEMKFLSRINDIRNDEAHWLYKFVFAMAVTCNAFWVAPTLVAIATFGTSMLVGIPLDSGKVLSAIATFKILQDSVYNLPDTISKIIQTKVSFDRIASFLSLSELDSGLVDIVPRGSSDTIVEVVDGKFSWDVTTCEPTLMDVNFKIFHCMKVAVCGPVGSGKSSLLSCILGEVPKLSGKVKLSGTKAYVGQSPWIQSGTIEQNILFGNEMHRERYEKVLEACDLKKDLEVLSFGDRTVIGERGINLSGGQKQRIQIARALYQDADIYLFDDPFSAVDAITGNHLFKECMMDFLESKTVIYVTHQVEFLTAADLILVLKDGRITQTGKYDDITKLGSDFLELVGAHKQALLEIDSVSENQGSRGKFNKNIQDETIKGQNGELVHMEGKKRQLVQEEKRERGKISSSTYWKYLTTAYGGALTPVVLLAHIMFESFQISSNYWLAWASPASESNEARVDDFKFIIVYVAFGIGCSLCILARSFLLMQAGYETANQLFDKMHFSIFRAPMSFFDANPSGRILSRVSSDQTAVDLSIPYSIGPFAYAIIQLLGIVLVMSLGAWPVFLVFFPVVGICIWLQQYYIPSARELARLVGVCKAPVIQHFSETISGSTTIRSFDQKHRFQDTCLKLIDDYSRLKFHVDGASAWFGLRLDMLSALIFALLLIFLVSVPEGIIDPSTAGLAVTYGLHLNKLQAWVILKLSKLEIQFISVERIFQYSSIPSEPPLVIDSNRPDRFWPSQGKVDIHHLQVRYAPHMPLVLRGITCTFHGGMKTGIVGRTGSGKSTLIQTLFRLVEPTSGEIWIDGINISSIGLHDLRSRLSIIPQDPTMFNGSVRSNMDPLEDYTDDQIWKALDKCQIGDEIRNKEGQLDAIVTENGENWSVGQRQLICLGRVLLKKSKILVLDEATASVDTATDNMIQKTLREHFSDSTVIAIAHRITSVVKSDMVLVLNNGVVEEYDSPTALLEDKSSSFSQLVAEYSLRSNSCHSIT
ncbi:putative ABC-type xenobiotic transporter [Helianthus annuus]|uniref:ABC-type xenobiotic transporter n=1 Tax=Helianthus annuus TaxID=4232 RepID=A0A251SVI8_HELAN|nr:ABC transporter C family member 3 [Helianthus annuus]KAF5774238.1 putative ABC-type xenobiotic transporter [Helianthus annuus]KAJ0482142.1 putative ABC-type xenobiotic transporter [Helianthus annuus]KAJ0664463.1 putative ABC-type xenobiotic transporter [Helianthus annuus]KAJ0671917.1 putative ABC-type xenobiotic transporter [Helianthus annuus]KAJ0850049.1 putative ABC-type xenobiotic transporter [Helianthus annuus]